MHVKMPFIKCISNTTGTQLVLLDKARHSFLDLNLNSFKSAVNILKA